MNFCFIQVIYNTLAIKDTKERGVMIQEKEYLKPNLDVIEYEDDVILTSGPCDHVGPCVLVENSQPDYLVQSRCSVNE